MGHLYVCVAVSCCHPIVIVLISSTHQRLLNQPEKTRQSNALFGRPLHEHTTLYIVFSFVYMQTTGVIRIYSVLSYLAYFQHKPFKNTRSFVTNLKAATQSLFI